MANILVRNVDHKVVESWKARAARNGRSLQAEIASALEEEAERDARLAAFAEWSEEFSKQLLGREHTDSAELRREIRPQ